MPSPPSGPTTLLTSLAASGVEFILVGGLAAVAQGAPITTFDVDVVHDLPVPVDLGQTLSPHARVSGVPVCNGHRALFAF